MTYLIILALTAVLSGVAGFLAGVKNAKSSKVAKAQDIVDAIRK